MKILLNPNNGAPIKNVGYSGQIFFDEKEGTIFEPNMVMQFEDKVADFFLRIFEFLEEIDATQAAEYMKKEKDTFKCEHCDFSTKVRIAFLGHSRKHEKEKAISELGIPIVKSSGSIDSPTAETIQKKWDKEDSDEGLIGEGLVNDRPRRTVVMS